MNDKASTKVPSRLRPGDTGAVAYLQSPTDEANSQRSESEKLEVNPERGRCSNKPPIGSRGAQVPQHDVNGLGQFTGWWI